MYICIIDEIKPKGLEWIGTSRKDMQALPLAVRRTLGYALYEDWARSYKTQYLSRALEGLAYWK